MLTFYPGWDENATEWINRPRTFDLTTDWTRYVLPLVIPARVKGQMFAIRIFGTGWLDGVQLEQGYEPTAFEE